MYGMYALEESVRQMGGTAPAQIHGARQDLGLPRRRRHVRRLRHDQHVERGAVSSGSRDGVRPSAGQMTTSD